MMERTKFLSSNDFSESVSEYMEQELSEILESTLAYSYDIDAEITCHVVVDHVHVYMKGNGLPESASFPVNLTDKIHDLECKFIDLSDDPEYEIEVRTDNDDDIKMDMEINNIISEMEDEFLKKIGLIE